MSAQRDLRNAQTALNEAVGKMVWAVGAGATFDETSTEVDDVCVAYESWDKQRKNFDTAGAASARQTSIVAGVTTIPNKGTLRRNILAAIIAHESQYGLGMNVSQLKAQLRKEHSSVSSAINALGVRSLIKDSGERRKTQYQKDAIVWVATDDAKRIYREALCQPG